MITQQQLDHCISSDYRLKLKFTISDGITRLIRFGITQRFNLENGKKLDQYHC